MTSSRHNSEQLKARGPGRADHVASRLPSGIAGLALWLLGAALVIFGSGTGWRITGAFLVSSTQTGAAIGLVDHLESVGLRVQLLDRGTLGATVRQARTGRAAHIAVIGQSEADAGTVTVGKRQLLVASLVRELTDEATHRKLRTEL
ncbi:His/Gly/Thr/Pro-type tRNA ligase C-terminal domain-containing protein [Diaminobutyricibacter sp. McL0618]|uniref:His/Gly/Thr/Pro-type tRNA ligase C-terminal domain-containing protein n=1 Tax=Leifsonia sp. McL0618 TaxID=3415677 RepID=UPI003CF9F6B1